jgi:hypothetical protein
MEQEKKNLPPKRKVSKFGFAKHGHSKAKLNFGSAGHHNRSGKRKPVSLVKLPPFREE